MNSSSPVPIRPSLLGDQRPDLKARILVADRPYFPLARSLPAFRARTSPPESSSGVVQTQNPPPRAPSQEPTTDRADRSAAAVSLRASRSTAESGKQDHLPAGSWLFIPSSPATLLSSSSASLPSSNGMAATAAVQSFSTSAGTRAGHQRDWGGPYTPQRYS